MKDNFVENENSMMREDFIIVEKDFAAHDYN